MSDYVHLRHKPPTPLERPRELILACPPPRSNINLSRMIRVAGCCGVRKVIACGTAKVVVKSPAMGADEVELKSIERFPRAHGIEPRATKSWLEQTSNSQSLHEIRFERKTVLVGART